MLARIVIFLFLTLSAVPASAHGDVHDRLLAVIKEIKHHPDSAFLYLKRLELYFSIMNIKNPCMREIDQLNPRMKNLPVARDLIKEINATLAIIMTSE
jgi:hypothetical protein